MIVKLLCRYRKSPDKGHENKIEKELEVERIIKGDSFDEEEARQRIELELQSNDNFEYGPFVLRLQAVDTFNLVDDQHTCTRLVNGLTYVFKIPFDQFEAIYQSLTGFVIHDITAVSTKSEKDGE